MHPSVLVAQLRGWLFSCPPGYKMEKDAICPDVRTASNFDSLTSNVHVSGGGAVYMGWLGPSIL